MNDLSTSFGEALSLVMHFDPDLYEIIGLSLQVSLSSVVIAALFALPFAALISITQFKGRQLVIGMINGLMGFPPVVMGLVIYLLLSRSGPLGVLGLLYTPTAMIIAQSLLVFPLIAAIALRNLSDLYQSVRLQFDLFGLNLWQRSCLMLYEGRSLLLTAILAGFGRAIAEVGAVMIVGGNIQHHTRVMTTAIALETSKGALSLALALGMILLLLAIMVNMLLGVIEQRLTMEKSKIR
ncbi:MAG: ABC transporter permease [Alphaproteobacteria bacterium]